MIRLARPTSGTALRLLVPYAVLVGLLAADGALGVAENVVGTLAVVPFVAALLSGPVITGAAAVATLIAVFFSSRADSLPADGLRVAVIAAASVMAVGLARSRVRRERQLTDVTRIADTAQRAILDSLPPSIGEAKVAATYVSAARGAHVGGDLYAAEPYGDGGMRLVVGDVRGKGLDAVRTSVFVLGAFRENAHTASHLDVLAQRMDLSLRRRLAADEFVTVILGELDGECLRLVSCGHPPPVSFRRGPLRTYDVAPSPPLGLVDARPRVTEHRVRANERILFYTDGLIEARTPGGHFIPLERLLASCRDDAPADRALEDLLAALQRATGGPLGDDLAMLVLTP